MTLEEIEDLYEKACIEDGAAIKIIELLIEKNQKLTAVAKEAKWVVECYKESSRPGNGGEESLQEALDDLEKD